MERECKRIQADLIDIFYEEKEMDEAIGMHLKCCEECRSHWESLHELRDEFTVLDTDVSIDVEGIKQAFQIAEERQKAHKGLNDLFIFLLVVFAIMSVVVGVAVMGYGMAVIFVQASIAVLTSLLLPLIYLRKLGREET